MKRSLFSLLSYVFMSAVPCLVLCTALWDGVFAQAPCLTPPVGPSSWDPNMTTVYYQIDASINNIPAGPGTTPGQQIINALNAWTQTNHTNSSQIVFAPAAAAHPPNLVIKADPNNTGTAAANTQSTSGFNTSQVITFFPNGQLPGGGPIYNPTAAGYD